MIQSKQKVITVHGLNSDGVWQAEVRRALEPHFDCHNVKYGEYRNLGLLALILEPRSLLVLLVVTYALAFVGSLQGSLLYLVPGAFLIVALLLAKRQRQRIVERFLDELAKIDEGSGYLRPRPHVIAHCFGTYLTEWALRSSSLELHNVILAGAVLPAKYDWVQLFEDKRAFRRLRNEVGRRDWITWLTFLSIPFCPGLGWAGWRGFKARHGQQPTVAVHDAAGLHGTCEICQWSAEPSVHNVRIREVTRSDRFIQARHVRTFWRPFLWDIDPKEYRYFLDLCSEAERRERLDKYDPELRELERDLGETQWSFLGRTLYEEIRARVLGLSADEMAYGLRLIWNCVALAWREEDKSPPQSRDEKVLQALKPQTAIQRAMFQLLKRKRPS